MQSYQRQDGGRHPELADPARLAAADPYGERLKILLAKGHYAAAKRMIDEAEFELDASPDKLADRSLSELGVSVRTTNALDEKLGVVTVGDLRGLSVERIAALPNFGPKSIDEIWQCVLRAALGDAGERGSEE